MPWQSMHANGRGQHFYVEPWYPRSFVLPCQSINQHIRGSPLPLKLSLSIAGSPCSTGTALLHDHDAIGQVNPRPETGLRIHQQRRERHTCSRMHAMRAEHRKHAAWTIDYSCDNE